MFVFKILPVLLLAVLAQASDLDKALELLACYQHAIEHGVPELDIPTHTPYAIRRNFTWTGTLGEASASLTFHNLLWMGLPNFRVKARQLSNDADPVAEFAFELRWDSVNLFGEVDAEFTQLIFEEHFDANIKSLWDDSTWTGTIKITKSDSDDRNEVNDVNVSWKTENIFTVSDGFGPFGTEIENLIDHGLLNMVNTDEFSEQVSIHLRERLNDDWFRTGKIRKLAEWCRGNGPTTTSAPTTENGSTTDNGSTTSDDFTTDDGSTTDDGVPTDDSTFDDSTTPAL